MFSWRMELRTGSKTVILCCYSYFVTDPNCVITPHIAWATREARTRLIRVLEENLVAFLAGMPQNIVGL